MEHKWWLPEYMFYSALKITEIRVDLLVIYVIEMKSRQYKFNNSTLTLIFGDIAESKSDVIVSSDDTEITMSGGVSARILSLGGESIQRDAQKKLPAQLGDVVVSSAGELQHQKYVFHCITLERGKTSELNNGQIISQEQMQNYILQHSLDKCFRLLHALDLKSIALPCIGTGAARIPLSKIASVMVDAIADNLAQTQKPIEVELYLYDRYGKLDPIDYIEIFESFAVKSALYGMKLVRETEKQFEAEPIVSVQEELSVAPTRDEMDHQVFISYSRRDIDKAKEITELLDSHSIRYWIDQTGIYSGVNYKEVIVDAIDTAKVVLFLSSVDSNASINVIRELGYAVRQNKTIIPVMLDDTPYAKSIKLDISDVDQMEISDYEKFRSKLISSIAYALKR